MTLDGKVAIVTGAASGFGEATARRFAAEGARIVVADRDAEKGAAVAESLGAAAIFKQGDVADDGAVARTVAAAVDAFGGLDVVVNNAGMVHSRMDMVDTPLQTWDRVMDVNVKSIFLFIRHAAPEIAKRGGGSIVNIASTASLKPRPGNVVYGTSKAAVVALTKGVAVELAPRNIRVNAILPVAAMTPVLMDFLGDGNEAQAEEIASRIPLGRLCDVTDIANAAHYLCSGEASFLTGVALPVDGGWTAG